MRRIILVILLPLFSVGQNLLSFDLESYWSISDIELIYDLGSLPTYVSDVNYEVNGYKVLYSTVDHTGQSVTASGVIFVPINTNCPSPILSWQHGTIVADSSAPSQKIDSLVLGILSASHGYVVIMSDYLGLGEGDGDHNYCHSDTEASAIIDLIFATNEFASNQGLNLNGQLFLMGYSQGGHSTMAAVKEIESSVSDFNITASSPMAGPYSMSEAQSEMLDVVYPNPGYFPYVIFSYQRIYGNLYNNVDELFRSGFENLEAMYDGTYSMDDINEQIWSISEELYDIPEDEFTPLDMIKPDYYYNYLNDEDHPFRLALQDNDLIDFIPQSPMRIVHCSGDDNVPYENAVLAYNSFTSFGFNEVILLDPGNFNHSDCASISVISAKLWFDEIAEFCNQTKIEYLNQDKKLTHVFDFFGRKIESNFLNNQLFFSFYSDGSVEKNINIID